MDVEIPLSYKVMDNIINYCLLLDAGIMVKFF